VIRIPRQRRALAAVLLATLGFTEGCRSLQSARPSELAPDEWIRIKSARGVALTVVPVDGSAAGAPCAAKSVEGRLRAIAGDTVHLRALANVAFDAEAAVHCFAGSTGYFLLSANRGAEISAARYDASRTRFFVVTAVVFAASLVVSFITADWTYSPMLPAPAAPAAPSR